MSVTEAYSMNTHPAHAISSFETHILDGKCAKKVNLIRGNAFTKRFAQHLTHMRHSTHPRIVEASQVSFDDVVDYCQNFLKSDFNARYQRWVFYQYR